MKIIKHLLLFVIAFIIGGAFFYFFQDNDNTIPKFLSPLEEKFSKTESKFSLENAPSESLKGEIASLKEVDWQSRTATQASPLTTLGAVQQGEKFITKENGQLSLVFANAGEANFKEKTEVEIIQTLPAGIVFAQTAGRATYKKTGGYPISVRAKSLLLEINGESTVTIDLEKQNANLLVVSGETIVAYNDRSYTSQVATVKAGQSLIFDYGTKTMALK